MSSTDLMTAVREGAGLRWHRRAACHPDNLPSGVSIEGFFVSGGSGGCSRAKELRAPALVLCRTVCKTRRECARYAVDIRAEGGVWGGVYLGGGSTGGTSSRLHEEALDRLRKVAA